MASPRAYPDSTSFSSLSPACKAAAAAARRKRRKALVRRGQSPHRFAKRTKTGSPITAPQPQQQISSKRPLPNATATASQQQQQEPQTTSSSPNARNHRKHCSSSNNKKKTNMIQPTLQGMKQVATNLHQGQVLALPTECTYEVVTQLDWREPNAWGDRIENLYSVVNVNVNSDSDNHYDYDDDEEEAVVLTTTTSPTQNTCVDTDGSAAASSNSNTAVAVSVASSSNSLASWSSADTTRGGSPTLGTLQQQTSSKADTKNQHVVQQHAHIYVPRPALTTADSSSSSLFWRQCFPKRPYAVRNKEGEVLAAHAFNETHAVLKLVSTKLWPGPVVIHVAVPHLVGAGDAGAASSSNSTTAAVATSNSSSMTGLTVQRNGKHYLALRSLCHPLMVKVHQEYLKTTTAMTGETKTASAAAAASPGSATSSARQHPVLVGMALPRPCAGTSEAAASFVTRASQVVVTAKKKNECSVLNGEAQADVFCVPTCEYGRPCPVSLWLDATERQIVLVRQTSRRQGNSHEHERHDAAVTGSQLLQILKSVPPPKTGQDRVVQAVLNRWRIKEVEERAG